LPILVLLAAAGAASAQVAPLPPGTYRLETRLVSHTSLPLIGTAESATVSLLRVQLRRDGAGFRQAHQVCDMRVEGGVALVRASVPARFIAALTEKVYPVTLAYDPLSGWRYGADLGTEQVGFRGDGLEPVPSRADDPRVYDSDGDGEPGATLKLSIAGFVDGEMYVAQRAHSALRGRVTALGQAAGCIDVREFRQTLLGAHPALLDRQSAIVVDAARSTFTMVRVADGTPCADLAAAPYDPGPIPDAPQFAAGDPVRP
jgi:hypothetical protein